MAEAVTHRTDTSDMLIPHGLLRSVLAGAGSIVDSVSPGDATHVSAVHSYFDNVLRFLDAHHGGEDAIVWPALIERCPSARALIAEMRGQHTTIHELRERVDIALTAWGHGADRAAGAGLAGALATLRLEIEAHFGREEREILPLASVSMSPEEWGALPGHAMGHFTGDKVWLILGLILERMTPEQRVHTLTLLPPPAVDMWTTMGYAAFDEFIARVRRAA